MAKNNDVVTLSWGVPGIEVLNLSQENAKWMKFPTPAESTTSLETTQGDKMEAKVEGGANEAVKYKSNTYQLTFEIRQALDRAQNNDTFIDDVDGVVQDEYAVRISPENPNAIYALIRRSSVNVQKTFTAEDGWRKIYTFEVLKPSDKADGTPVPQVQLGAKESIGDWDMNVTA